MSKTREQIVAELDSKIPASAVAERDGGGGKRLSYLTGHYVIDRLNKVVGIGNWGYVVKELKNLYTSTSADDRGRFNTAYSAIVELSVELPAPPGERFNSAIIISDVGYGDGMDRAPTKAHELALKEAVTDALKRAAKSLGMSMGLALYDKEQTNVEDDSREAEAPKAAPSPSPKQAPAPHPVFTVKKSNSPGNKEVASKTKDQLLEMTKAQGMVLQKVKGFTLDQVKEVITTKFGSRQRQELSESELQDLSTTFETILAS